MTGVRCGPIWLWRALASQFTSYQSHRDNDLVVLNPTICSTLYLGVALRGGTPQSSSILYIIRFFIINHPFWGILIFWKHPIIETEQKLLTSYFVYGPEF